MVDTGQLRKPGGRHRENGFVRGCLKICSSHIGLHIHLQEYPENRDDVDEAEDGGIGADWSFKKKKEKNTRGGKGLKSTLSHNFPICLDIFIETQKRVD